MIGGIWKSFVGLFADEEIVDREVKLLKPSAAATPPPPLEDADYELLFAQLLEGVRLGWDRTRVLQYLADLGDRGDINLWADWMRRFADRLLASPAPQELGLRLLQLGQLGCGELSEQAIAIGSQLLQQEVSLPVEKTGEKEPAAPPSDAEGWFVRGNEQLNSGNYLGAIASYEEAVKLDPEFPAPWINLGAVLFFCQRPEDALKCFDTVLKLISDDANLWFNRGFTLSALSRPAEAIDSYEKAIQLQPDFLNAWHNRGIALTQLERYGEAIGCYERAIHIKPDFPEAWYSTGSALAQLKRDEEAIACYDKALQFKPDYADAWFHRGLALRNAERNEEAISSFDRAVTIQPDNYRVWINRGLALLSCNRHEDAIASFDSALKLRPDDPEALARRQEAIAASDSQAPRSGSDDSF